MNCVYAMYDTIKTSYYNRLLSFLSAEVVASDSMAA